MAESYYKRSLMKKVFFLTSFLLTLPLLTGCQTDYLANREVFANPGGMWMPHQLERQTKILASLGVDDPGALSDPLAHPLGAIVWLGGCSASFVSPDGLIITNHHCANGSLQYHSTPECNLFDEGFLARSREEELPGEIGKKVWVTQEIIGVTEMIRKGLAKIEDPLDRHESIETRIKGLIAQHEKTDDSIRCSVKSYFEGQKYYLIKQLEIKDVRLVYAPESGVGCFGGHIDNWRWPRHTGDFTFYRAYVAPDGSPAEYAPDNVPYKPKHYLRIADEPLQKNDFVMVAGYPGRTQRWRTAEQIRFSFEENNPSRIQILTEVAKVYETLAAESEDLRIKVTPSIKGVMNYLQLLEFTQDNIRQNDLIARKNAQQAELVDWVQADAKRLQKWGQVLDDITVINAMYQKTAYRDYLIDCVIRHVRLIDAGGTIVRMAEEHPKPDSERDPDFQQRNWDRMIQGQQRMQKSYDPAIDKAVLTYYLNKISDLPAQENEPIKAVLDAGALESAENIKLFVSGLFTDALTINDPDVRVELFKNASLEQLQNSEDPFIQLALKLRPLTKELEDKADIYDGRMALLLPEYVQARKAFYDRPLASDANGTLRVTYGTVRGYRPTPDAAMYEPFSTLTQLVQKDTGDEPFNSPQALLDAAANRPCEPPFWSERIDDVPVNFLSDLDITGGNSGSATLNRKGQIVGLVFDGNSESLASNLLFMPNVTRAIHVDIRYVLWVMRYVDQAENLLEELAVE